MSRLRRESKDGNDDMKKLAAFVAFLALTGCFEEETVAGDPPVRGLKTHLVAATERSTLRRFPGVLEPTSLNVLSFDISGKLTAVSLQIGQRVAAGEVLAALDTEALEIQVRNAEAGLRSAEAALARANEDLARQEELFERGTITLVARDAARTEATTRAAQLEQAQQSLASARDTLAKAELTAPFDAVVNSVEVQSFATVTAATPIVSLYAPDVFEISFTADFEVISQLVVGSPARVRLADRPDLVLAAQVSEIGARADTVSSFPVVLSLTETDPILKAGMAVEASLELPLPAAEGFLIPLTAVIKEGTIADQTGPGEVQVFVYDPAGSTVQRRDIRIAGVRENALLVVDGLSAGERVASAGVSFLREGQEVRLLSGEE